MTQDYKYKAFISYSHSDQSWASWLHRQLEGYRPPENLSVSDRLFPVFQDREELSAASDLSRTIEQALRASESLIVVCSPAAVASRWVRTEIERFIEFGRDERIFCVIVDGTPGDPEAECLPEPLRPRQPLAVDVRPTGHGRANATLRLIAALLGVDYDVLRRRDTSIAVLPFRDLSPFGDKAYLADGIAEELLNHLTRLNNLKVIARNSSFQFRDGAVPLREIGERLDATYLVDGSVRTMGEAMRVSAQLIDTRTDASRWSKTYDRDLEDIFTLQDEIAADVAHELQTNITRRARQTVRADTYQLILRARHLAKQFTRQALDRSNELLLRAIAQEPDCVDALNCLAANYYTQVGEGFLPLDGLSDSRAALEQVLAIDAENLDALSSLAWLSLRFDNDLVRAADHLKRALASGLNSLPVLNSVGGLLIRLRRPEEAILVARRVIGLDPLNPFAFANLGVYSLLAGRPDDAIEAYRTTLELSPGFVGAQFAIGLALLLLGEPEQALHTMEREPDDEFRTKGRAIALFDRGDLDAFHAELDALIRDWGQDWPAEVAEVYAYAGMADEAFEWIFKAVAEDQGSGWAESVLNPAYRKLRDDPRWKALLSELGLTPERLAGIEFTLPDGLNVPG